MLRSLLVAEALLLIAHAGAFAERPKRDEASIQLGWSIREIFHSDAPAADKISRLKALRDARSDKLSEDEWKRWLLLQSSLECRRPGAAEAMEFLLSEWKLDPMLHYNYTDDKGKTWTWSFRSEAQEALDSADFNFEWDHKRKPDADESRRMREECGKIIKLLDSPEFYPPMPEWELKNTAGKALRSDSLKGKVVLIQFGETSCGPCMKRVPELIALQDRLGKAGFSVVAMSMSIDASEALKRGINYPVVSHSTQVEEDFRTFSKDTRLKYGIPLYFLFDSESKLVAAGGSKEFPELVRLAEERLKREKKRVDPIRVQEALQEIVR